MNTLYHANRNLQRELKKIPKENKAKFYSDLLILIEKAQGSDYDNYDIDF